MNDSGRPNAVAIVGRPNVGKSALFNRLVGRKIAIVHDQPGVTRDRLSALCTRGTIPFILWDTGGVAGAGESELTADVRRKVHEAVEQSDVLLFMVDAQQGLTPVDEDLARLLRRTHKPIVLVINKIDVEKHELLAADFARLGFDRAVPISAAHGGGITELLETIEQLLPQKEGSFQPDPSPDLEATKSGQSRIPPLPIAIVGRPNVGKSSFVNAITQSERAIVSELPGTTRDAVDIEVERRGERFLFIDTAGIRKRSKHSTSVEVFSVMRSERTIRRAKLCVLIIDVTAGVTAQDKKIAGLIQQARKPAIVVANKFDLVKPRRGVASSVREIVEDVRDRLFFLPYAPVLVTSALTQEHVDKLFSVIKRVRRYATIRIGTGVLNRLLRSALAANPSPMISGRRLKLFYATQALSSDTGQTLGPIEFVLFVNEPRLLSETYARYLEAQIRQASPYEGVPLLLTCRARTETRAFASRRA